jgi:hypothetical protein
MIDEGLTVNYNGPKNNGTKRTETLLGVIYIISPRVSIEASTFELNP